MKIHRRGKRLVDLCPGRRGLPFGRCDRDAFMRNGIDSGRHIPPSAKSRSPRCDRQPHCHITKHTVASRFSYPACLSFPSGNAGRLRHCLHQAKAKAGFLDVEFLIINPDWSASTPSLLSHNQTNLSIYPRSRQFVDGPEIHTLLGHGRARFLARSERRRTNVTCHLFAAVPFMPAVDLSSVRLFRPAILRTAGAGWLAAYLRISPSRFSRSPRAPSPRGQNSGL
ncbi:hypothetical protein F4778DRAFT_696437 [Xylariomycetidae sp. FL2044]|nr:hypothetical protein F4778DRAFT_696437 [Xylariomycetidae sp. FL2044]